MNIDLVFFIIIGICIILFFSPSMCSNNMEHFDAASDAKAAVNSVYQADVGAIRTLADIATKLQTNGYTCPGNFNVTGPLNVHKGDPYAVPNGRMANGSLTIGGGSNYGGGNNWTGNTAGLLMECNGQTEIAVHHYGHRVASLMNYNNNNITIGRDMAWGPIGSTTINSDLILPNGWKISTGDGHLRFYKNGDQKMVVHDGHEVWFKESGGYLKSDIIRSITNPMQNTINSTQDTANSTRAIVNDRFPDGDTVKFNGGWIKQGGGYFHLTGPNGCGGKELACRNVLGNWNGWC
jgi:hypothetical protein